MTSVDEISVLVGRFIESMNGAGNPGAVRLGRFVSGWEIGRIDYRRIASGPLGDRRVIGEYLIGLTTAGAFIRRIHLRGAGVVDRLRHLVKRSVKPKSLAAVVGPDGLLSPSAVGDRLAVIAGEHGVAL